MSDANQLAEKLEMVQVLMAMPKVKILEAAMKLQSKVTEQEQTIFTQATRIAELERDAARYQWIVKNTAIEIKYGSDGEDWPVTLYEVSGSRNDRRWKEVVNGNTLSDAIDSAIQGEKQ